MTDAPAMLLWTDAYLGDTGHLTTVEHGAYLLILMAMWRAGGSLPNDEKRLSRTAKLSLDKWRKIAPTILAFMTVADGQISQKRLKLEFKIEFSRSQKRASAGRAGGRAKALRMLNPAPGNATVSPVAKSKQTPSLPEPVPEPVKKDSSESDDSLVNDAVVDPGPVGLEKPKKDRDALRAFGEAWNELAAALDFPSIDEIEAGSTRERHALARLRKMPPNGVQALMARIRGSPYLRGEVNGFRVSFDWIINASNYQKIMEGNYEDRKIASLRR